MSKTGHVSAGLLDQPVEVLALMEDGGEYSWRPIRCTWARAELSAQKNVYSVHGIGAAGVGFTLRRQPLALDNALRWRGKHCTVTSILPLDRGHMQVGAALVSLSRCEDKYAGVRFPGIMTEKYLGHAQQEPQAVNTLRHVLVTPKAIRLTPGRLVEVEGESWPILTAHLLDPWKNEYELERTVDL